MKKEYVKPTVVVEEFVAEVSFLDASGIDVTDKPVEGGDANSHRGGWGDLWN